MERKIIIKKLTLFLLPLIFLFVLSDKASAQIDTFVEAPVTVRYDTDTRIADIVVVGNIPRHIKEWNYRTADITIKKIANKILEKYRDTPPNIINFKGVTYKYETVDSNAVVSINGTSSDGLIFESCLRMFGIFQDYKIQSEPTKTLTMFGWGDDIRISMVKTDHKPRPVNVIIISGDIDCVPVGFLSGYDQEMQIHTIDMSSSNIAEIGKEIRTNPQEDLLYRRSVREILPAFDSCKNYIKVIRFSPYIRKINNYWIDLIICDTENRCELFSRLNTDAQETIRRVAIKQQNSCIIS